MFLSPLLAFDTFAAVLPAFDPTIWKPSSFQRTTRMWTFVSLFALLPLANALKCDVEPLSLSYGFVTTLDSPPVVESPHKSLGLIFGGAKKLLAMGFGTTANSTFVPDFDSLCNASHPDVRSCIFWRGGVFSPEKSSTWVKDDRTKYYNGSASNEGWDYLNAENYKDRGDDPIASFTRGWDTVDLGKGSLNSFPFSVIDNSSFPFGTGMVGLATDSVFLKNVVESDLAPSRSWGFDFGRVQNNVDQPGELVLGGYNPTLATYQDFTNYTVFPNKSAPCPLQVEVEGMKWGDHDLMANGQKSFMACIEPAYWTMILPLQVQRNWNNSLIGDYGYTWWKHSWEFLYLNQTNGIADFPDIDMEITLSKNFTVKIPKSELYRQAVQINATRGGWDPITGDNDTIQVNMGTAAFPPNTEPKLPFLGGPFLSQVYLAVDYENNIFSLANTKRDSTSAQPLRALACDKTNVTTSPSSSPSKNNTGKIAGGVVGGALGLIAIAGLVFFIFRRRKQPKPVQPSPEQGVIIGNDKKEEDVPRYTSPFSPYGAYPPPPPPESVTSVGSPYPYTQSHYSGTTTWATSPPLPPQQLAANASERGDAAELGPGSPLIEETPMGTLSSNPAHRGDIVHTL